MNEVIVMVETKIEKKICSHRHASRLDNIFRKLYQSPKKIVGPYLKPGDTAIDIGCGPGFFTIPMAEMVGSSGTVIGVDLQKEMLEKLTGKMRVHHNESQAGKITAHQCTQNSLELDQSVKADFILACYMVHETVDQVDFFRQTRTHLKPTGRLLVIEPPFHVTNKSFGETIKTAELTGLMLIDRPKRKGGFCALFGIPAQ